MPRMMFLRRDSPLLCPADCSVLLYIYKRIDIQFDMTPSLFLTHPTIPGLPFSLEVI